LARLIAVPASASPHSAARRYFRGGLRPGRSSDDGGIDELPLRLIAVDRREGSQKLGNTADAIR
jgi:hypothetical protein